MIKFYNTLSRKKEIFKSLKDKKVGLYTCGPTVYWFAHIGNLRTYIFEDILRRVLEYNKYKVKHVMNITDVGHLTSDADTGEDKLEKGARREKKTVWQIAEFYTKHFKKDLKNLNIEEPTVWIKATDTIKEQIDLIKILEKKGFTYKIKDGIYFDTSKLENYGWLWGSKKREIKAGARVKMVPGKKHPTDFALWKFSPSRRDKISSPPLHCDSGKGVKRQMEWDSPWGKGFPGWHTECVVMGVKELGIPFDIHCGGIDHIPIHHTNEIAQSEAAYNKILACFWLHGEFLVLKQGRMGKSEGNIIILDDLFKKGFNPLAYRYLCLQTHYRSRLNFSWLALKASQNALDNLYQKTLEISEMPKHKLSENISRLPKLQLRWRRRDLLRLVKKYQEKFLEFINDDLNTPKAVALMWEVIKSPQLSNQEKYKLILNFDEVFGLELKDIKKEKIPEELLSLAKQRQKYREQGLWQKADEIRGKIKKLGYWVEDTKEGPKIKKI